MSKVSNYYFRFLVSAVVSYFTSKDITVVLRKFSPLYFFRLPMTFESILVSDGFVKNGWSISWAKVALKSFLYSIILSSISAAFSLMLSGV